METPTRNAVCLVGNCILHTVPSPEWPRGTIRNWPLLPSWYRWYGCEKISETAHRRLFVHGSQASRDQLRSLESEVQTSYSPAMLRLSS